MFNNQLLYKEIKNYKNLENHFINGKIEKDNELIFEKKYVQLKFLSNKKNKNMFRVSQKFISQRSLLDRGLISYDVEQKQIVHKGFANMWYSNNDNINVGEPFQHKYLKKSFINLKYNTNKKLFSNMEYKNNLEKLEKKKLPKFKDLILWKKLHKYNYVKIELKVLLLEFLHKQNVLRLTKDSYNENLIIESILLDLNHKDLVFYAPALFKVFSIPHYFLKNNINTLLKKKKKKKKDLLLIYFLLVTFKLIYKLDIKYYKKIFN